MKHKKHDLSLEELVRHMKVEEANHLKDKSKAAPADHDTKANLVEFSGNRDRFKKGDSSSGSKKDKDKFKKPSNKKVPPFKKPGNQDKAKQGCYVCGKPCHRAYQCYNRADGGQKPPTKLADQPKPQANVTEDNRNLIAMISEVNHVENKVE